MTAWTQPRTITVHIPPAHKTDPDFKIGFKVEPAQREEFSKLFENYLEFCHRTKSTIRVKDEVVDVDTGELCSITFELFGERNVVGPELQRIGNDLLRHSTRVK